MLKRLIVQPNPQEIPLQELSQRINSSNAELEEVELAIQNKKEELDGLDVVMEASKKASVSILEEEKAKRGQLETVTQELISKKSELSDAKDILLSVENKTIAKEGELIQHEAKVKELATIATKHEETARTKAIEVSELEARNSQLVQQIFDNGIRMAKQEAIIYGNEQKIADTENEISNIKARASLVSDAIDTLKVRKTGLEEEVQVLNNSVADLKTAQKGEESLLAEKKQEVFNVEQEIIQLREEKAGVITMLDEKIGYLGRLKKDIEEKKEIGEL